MARRIYVGSRKAIVTQLDGYEMTVERGEAVDVSDEQAAVLDRCPANWAKPKFTTPTPPVSDDTKDGD